MYLPTQHEMGNNGIKKRPDIFFSHDEPRRHTRILQQLQHKYTRTAARPQMYRLIEGKSRIPEASSIPANLKDNAMLQQKKDKSFLPQNPNCYDNNNSLINIRLLQYVSHSCNMHLHFDTSILLTKAGQYNRKCIQYYYLEEEAIVFPFQQCKRMRHAKFTAEPLTQWRRYW